MTEFSVIHIQNLKHMQIAHACLITSFHVNLSGFTAAKDDGVAVDPTGAQNRANYSCDQVTIINLPTLIFIGNFACYISIFS